MRTPLTSRTKSLTTQPPEATILSITIRRRSATATPPSIFFSSREVRNAGLGRLSATTARFIVPGSFPVEAEDLNAGLEALTTRGRVALFAAVVAAGAGTLASAIITGGGNAVLASAEFAGSDGNAGADTPDRRLECRIGSVDHTRTRGAVRSRRRSRSRDTGFRHHYWWRKPVSLLRLRR